MFLHLLRSTITVTKYYLKIGSQCVANKFNFYQWYSLFLLIKRSNRCFIKLAESYHTFDKYYRTVNYSSTTVNYKWSENTVNAMIETWFYYCLCTCEFWLELIEIVYCGIDLIEIKSIYKYTAIPITRIG